jgi:Asp-tRNA(Asn)/Glu-tRNA(Gln) amidotransferase A subunit family amidase
MPLGMQLVGAHLQDTRLLQVAQWCADQIGFRSNPAEQ